jgi:hypothetical protein
VAQIHLISQFPKIWLQEGGNKYQKGSFQIHQNTKRCFYENIPLVAEEDECHQSNDALHNVFEIPFMLQYQQHALLQLLEAAHLSTWEDSNPEQMQSILGTPKKKESSKHNIYASVMAA